MNKISAPRISTITHRERLFQLLDQGLERPMMWISGPGGSGKSTLVASYLQSRRIPCTWYQIDEGDADPATIFYYLRLAAKRAAPRFRKPLPLFSPEYHGSLKVFARRYFEELFRRLKPPHILVLDDYHEVASDSPFHEVVAAASDEIPDGVHIVVTSRRPHPQEMARLCSRRKIAFVGWSELRLTADETTEIVRLHQTKSGLGWDSAIGPLHGITEGWVAGLVLLLERGRPEDLGQSKGKGLAQEDIFRYFAGELFKKVPTHVRDIMLKSAFLPTIATPLAAMLTGNPEAGRILAELHEANLFTERRHDTEPIYRFHPLLREYLLREAETAYKPQQLSEIRQQAAELLEQSGRIEEAAGLRQLAGDAEGLARLILCNAGTFIAQGRSRTVLEWLEGVSHALQEREPYLLFWQGAALFSHNPTESRSRFRKAFLRFRTQGDRTGMFLSWCAVVDTAIHASEYLPMREWVEVLGAVLQNDAAFPTRDVEVRVALSLFNAVAFAMPDHPDIEGIRERAFALICSERIADANLFLSTALHLTIHFIYQGDFTNAGATLHLLQTSARAKEASDLVKIAVSIFEAHYAFATCALDDCIKKAFEGLALASASGIHLWETHTYGHAISAALSKGDVKAAHELLPKMAAGLATCRSVDKCYYYWLRAWDAAIGGSFPEARKFLQLGLQLVPDIGFVAPQTAITISAAEVCIEMGDHGDAASFLHAALPVVERMQSAYLRFYYLITESSLHFAQGEERKGMSCLEAALSTGKGSRLENFYFWRPSLMSRLCLRALEAGIEEDYVRTLIRRRQLFPEGPLLECTKWPWRVRAYALGRFSVEIDGRPLSFVGKAQRKPLDLLKALIAIGGAERREGEIADLLWPESDADLARNAMKITLHRLRRLLGCDSSVRLEGGLLLLDSRIVWTDAAFGHICREAAREEYNGDLVSAAKHAQEAMKLYHGELLPGESTATVVSVRDHLRSLFIRNAVLLGSKLESCGAERDAVDVYMAALSVERYSEELYQCLIRNYFRRGLDADARSVFSRCLDSLRLIGLQPSQVTLTLASFSESQ